MGASIDELVEEEAANSTQGQRSTREEVNNDQETAADNREKLVLYIFFSVSVSGNCTCSYILALIIIRPSN